MLDGLLVHTTLHSTICRHNTDFLTPALRCITGSFLNHVDELSIRQFLQPICKIMAGIARNGKIFTTQLLHSTDIICNDIPGDVGVYEVGKRVKNRFRFLEAHDMTIEAVVTKSMWLLAQNCDSFDQLQQRFYRQVNFDTFYH